MSSVQVLPSCFHDLSCSGSTESESHKLAKKNTFAAPACAEAHETCSLRWPYPYPPASSRKPPSGIYRYKNNPQLSSLQTINLNSEPQTLLKPHVHTCARTNDPNTITGLGPRAISSRKTDATSTTWYWREPASGRLPLSDSQGAEG